MNFNLWKWLGLGKKRPYVKKSRRTILEVQQLEAREMLEKERGRSSFLEDIDYALRSTYPKKSCVPFLSSW